MKKIINVLSIVIMYAFSIVISVEAFEQHNNYAHIVAFLLAAIATVKVFNHTQHF